MLTSSDFKHVAAKMLPIEGLYRSVVFIGQVIGNFGCNMFEIFQRMKQFVRKHKIPGTWTDDSRLMVQAAAMYVNRHIRLVGTANTGNDSHYTEVKSSNLASCFIPITIGYIQHKHFISLVRVLDNNS